MIISASRATDIPAFHSQWLLESLRAGYVDKVNPYNRKKIRIEFSRARAIVFWTKNPAPLLPHLPAITDLGLKPVFLFTLNDYEAEGWEPGLPPLMERLAAFARLAELLPKGALAWRFDPIALGGDLGPEGLLARIENIHKRIAPFTEKLIFSFVDLYPKVRRRLARLALDLRTPDGDERELILNGLAGLKRRSSTPLRLCSCAGDEDYGRLGIERSNCVDASLLAGLCPELAGHKELFSGAGSGPLFGSELMKPLKDKGQRSRCRCAPSRDIGNYNTCGHGCVYCYANK